MMSGKARDITAVANVANGRSARGEYPSPQHLEIEGALSEHDVDEELCMQEIASLDLASSYELDEEELLDEEEGYYKSDGVGSQSTDAGTDTHAETEVNISQEAASTQYFDASSHYFEDDEEDASSYEFAASEFDEEEEHESDSGDGDRSHDMGYFDCFLLEPTCPSTGHVLPSYAQSTAGPNAAATNSATDPGDDDDEDTRPAVDEFKQLLARTNGVATIFNGYWKSHVATISQQQLLDRSFLPPILQSFRSYLESNSFLPSCARMGLIGPKFTWREPLPAVAGKFLASGIPSSGNNDRKIKFGLAFHGTASRNIESILRNGLDPLRRCGQSYGVGEYFGQDPGVSLYYCKGGLRMLVFCIVAVQPERELPAGYVVVKETSYQLPLGVLSFTSTTPDALNRSTNLRSQLQTLMNEAHAREQLAQEARLKSAVIQLIIKGDLEVAANCFKKAFDKLSKESQREIAYYAYNQRTWDEEFVVYYFGENLPVRSECSWENVEQKIKSVEDMEKQAGDAWGKVDKALKGTK